MKDESDFEVEERAWFEVEEGEFADSDVTWVFALVVDDRSVCMVVPLSSWEEDGIVGLRRWIVCVPVM